MAVSVRIKKTRDPRKKYVFSVSKPNLALEDTDARVKRIAEEIAKYLAGQMFQQKRS